MVVMQRYVLLSWRRLDEKERSFFVKDPEKKKKKTIQKIPYFITTKVLMNILDLVSVLS